jgi:predicted RNase H-like nuclease (RuvC/YqgF family)
MSTADKWLRPQYKGRENELETRTDFEKRTGITTQSLSSMFTRYADRIPGVVKKWGKTKYFVASELDGFVEWISENSGKRTEADVRRAELARLDNSIEEAEERVSDRERDLEKARYDLTKFRRQRRSTAEELAFLEQAE